VPPGPFAGREPIRRAGKLRIVPDPQTEISLPLVSRRRQRAQLFQKIQHAAPAIALIGSGLHGVTHEHGAGFALAVGELVVSLLLLRTLAKELVAARRPHAGHAPHPRHGVDWFDIFVAGVLTAEALEHWHTHHHVARPTILLAVVMLALGLFHAPLHAWTSHRRRLLRIDASGIRVRGRFFREFFAPWPDIERIDLDGDKARIVANGNRVRRIDLDDLTNASEVRQALLVAQERLTSLPPHAAP
jgi:hypothetical protein